MTREDLLSALVTLRGRVAELEARQAILDASGIKTAAEALRELEEKFRALVENAHEGIHVAQDGILKFVNPALAKMYGQSEENLLSRPFTEFIHPDDRELILDRSLRRARGEELPGRYPHRVVTEDGRIKWLEINSAPISWEGKPAVLVFTTDITERKRMEEAIREQEEQYGALVEESFDGIMIIKETKIVFVNSRLCQMLGYSKVELEGMDHWLTVHSDYRDLVHDRALARARGESVPPHYEVKFQRKDGSVFDGEIRARSIELQGTPGVQVWIRDITERKRSEEALRASEAQLSNAVKMARLGHWEYDVAKDLFTFNDHFYRLFRTTADQVGGYTMSSADYAIRFLHPDDIDVVRKEIRKSIETTDPHSSQQLDHRILYADGEVGYITVRIFVIKDEMGRTVRTYGVNQDITERKRAEEALRKSEERLELALHGGDLGLWDLHIPTDQAAINQRAADIVGYSIDKIEQSSSFWWSLIHPGDRQRALEQFHNHLAGLTNLGEQEYRVRHKNGDWKWVLSRGKITERDPDGKPLRMTGTFLDITERKLAEAQAAESNELRDKIFSDSPVGIAVYRADGQCVSANEALGRIVGADKERLLTQNFRDLASWKESGLLAYADEVLSGGISNQREFQLTTTFGKSLWVEARMACLTSGGEPHLLLVFNDITDRKKAEEERETLKTQLMKAQKMESIGTLAGGIAHDFNNLLTIIRGFAELLVVDMDEDNPSRSDLQRIVAAASSGASLVQRLLTFSRQAETRPEPLDVKHEIQQVTELLSRTISRMISLDLRLAEDAAPIYGDSEQIQQVVMNLALNAADAMPNGGKLTIDVKNVVLDPAYCATHPGLQPGDYVMLAFSDTGHGMDAQTIERMCDPFFSTKTRASDKGTGLGLAVVHSIVEQHRGRMTCDSEPGKGARFELYFPAMKTEK